MVRPGPFFLGAFHGLFLWMYPSLLPKYYRQPPIGPQNSTVFLDVFKEAAVPLIDFSYLKQWQDTLAYPIYSPAGMHFSRYGLGLMMDNLRSRAEALTGMAVPKPLWRDSIIWEKGSDYWFYFNIAFPPREGIESNEDMIDWLAKIKQQDLVVLLCYDTNLPDFGFGFIEKLYDLIEQ